MLDRGFVLAWNSLRSVLAGVPLPVAMRTSATTSGTSDAFVLTYNPNAFSSTEKVQS